jgi:hypothetical protein
VLEVRQIELINKLLRQGHLGGSKYRKKRFHLISNNDFMEGIGATSKIVPSRDFLIARDRQVNRQAVDRQQFRKARCRLKPERG